MTSSPAITRWILALLLLGFALRVAALTVLPLHNDEGLHLTRAVEVWHGHPFWDITDGKIINHWLIAAFYPQNAPDFAARYPTVLLSVVGMAAAMALGHAWGGRGAALWTGVLWITSGYLLFYERIGQSDAQAGALVTVAVWRAVIWTRRRRWGDALVTGGFLAWAVLMKFTAAPYALVVVAVMWMSDAHWRHKLGAVSVVATVGVLAFIPPIAYLLLRGLPLFNIALGWLGGGGGDGGTLANMTTFGASVTGFGVFGVVWGVVLMLGVMGALFVPHIRPLALLAIFPPALMMLVSSDVFPRHFVVTLPLLVVTGGVAWARWRMPSVVMGGIVATLAVAALPFMWTAWTSPANTHLPERVAREFLHDHSAGFGLREAAAAWSEHVPPDTPIIASMFPSSCRRTNFYVTDSQPLTCTDAPALDAIHAELSRMGTAWVLVDTHTGVGTTREMLNADVQTVAVYPRPGESAQTATVQLWRVTSR
jgi:hypothetical protein